MGSMMRLWWRRRLAFAERTRSGRKAISPWTDSDQPVRISGWLFFDSEHGHDLGKRRTTLWEIHPITKIEVFKGGKWISLDNVE